MLLLWPSLLMLGTPMILERMELRWQYVDLIMTRILAFAVMLCFVLGFRLEKWLRGEIKSIVWALNYGFMILLGNGVVLFAVFTAFFFRNSDESPLHHRIAR